MGFVEFEVQGIEKLMSALVTMSNPDFADQTLRKGLMLAGKQVQGTAKQLCHVVTSQLRNSIEVAPIENGVSVGTNVKQAIFEEFGTGKQGDPSVTHTTKDRWSYRDKDGNWHTTQGHEPHPFLYPALKANEQNIVRITKDTLQSEIDRLVK